MSEVSIHRRDGMRRVVGVRYRHAEPATENTWGHSGRYIGRALGFYEINAGLEKRFPIHETWSASFRAEAFNLLNHAILNAPPANISTPATFGRINGSSNPRKLQLMYLAN